MADSDRRKNERALKNDPHDEEARMRLIATAERDGLQTEHTELRQHLGHWIFIEGARMNQRGKLIDIILDGAGQVMTLILEPGYRLGDFNAQGPNAEYEARNFPGRRMVRWFGVLECGRQPDHWPTT